MFNEVSPVFLIDDDIKELLDLIKIKLKLIEINDRQKRKYLTTKSKVRSIHSSLSIEANSLSLFDVENISINKPVLGKKDEIQEVKNAIEAYQNINKYNYENEEDLLKVHQVMMKYIDENNGKYRNHGEGITKENKIIYMAPDSILVPGLIKSLFKYIKNNKDLDIFILSSIFHYYFVSIHPFSDGNGRVARYWVSLMLIKYNKNFEFIPIEEEIYLNQKEYYSSISKCHINSNANEFIKFMLKMVNSAIVKVINNNLFLINQMQNRILQMIINNKYVTQNELANVFNVSVRTIKRNFKVLIEHNIIKRVGSNKNGYWEMVDDYIDQFYKKLK